MKGLYITKSEARLIVEAIDLWYVNEAKLMLKIHDHFPGLVRESWVIQARELLADPSAYRNAREASGIRWN